MLRVIAYTGAPSGVFRVRQYVGPLRASGIEMQESASRWGSFPPSRKWLRPLWGVCNLSERAIDTARSSTYDVALFQRELLSTSVTWERFAKRPRIFDVDDAVWTHRRGHFAAKLARLCDHVICGNHFVAEQFSRWNPNVSILPTPVDVHRFCPQEKQSDPDRPIIGWMGLHTNLAFLYAIEPALREVLQRHPKAKFRIVTGLAPKFRSLPADQVEFIPWTPANEASTMQEMTFGIMPLNDTLSARGKCSYKMLLYMACGLPVVVSPVGMNEEVLNQDTVGFGAVTNSDWVEHMDKLLRDPDLCMRMGRAGRNVVMQHYSVEVLAPRLANTLRHVTGTE